MSAAVARAPEAQLVLDDVTVSYGGVLDALQHVNLSVGAGEIVALLGANGAGKTTILRAISRNLRRHRARIVNGAIRFEGADLQDASMSDLVGRGIVQVPEGRKIFSKLTVEENLRVGSARRRDRAAVERSRERVYELFPVLAERRAQPGTLLSGGEQQMLAIGRALMAQPRLLMLDEPSLGLAPKIVDRIGEVIREINADGTSVLLIEQNANMALGIADRAYVLELGRVSLEGSSKELLASEEIAHLYLGHSAEDDDAPAIEITKRIGPWEEA